MKVSEEQNERMKGGRGMESKKRGTSLEGAEDVGSSISTQCRPPANYQVP